MTDCIFCKIVSGELEAKVVYEDDLCLAFEDIYPKAPVHLLLIPKKHIISLQDLTEHDQQLIGHMMLILPKLAARQGLDRGFRTQINTGKAGGQEVFHLHIHLLGNISVSD